MSSSSKRRRGRRVVPPSVIRSPRYLRFAPALLLIVAGIIVYANSVSGVFLFDDWYHIEQSGRIRQLWPPGGWLSSSRPLLTLTLAVNYALGRLNPLGYHIVNLIVHVLAGLTLFGVIRRTLTRGALRVPFGRAAPGLAFTAALIWLVHPLQTQSVTYVIQRGESLMGLCYLCTLYCAIRGFDAHRSAGWYAGAVLACALGMVTKAVMVTAPLMVLAYDAIFVTQSIRESIRRRWWFYLGLVATWGLLWFTGTLPRVFGQGERVTHVGFSYGGIPPWRYALTQVGVLARYLKLSFRPVDLCLDYDWPVARGVTDVLRPALVMLPIMAATVWALLRKPSVGFLGFWFFVVLAPTSSIIPIKDVIFEHRMYLSLAAVVVAVVLGAYSAWHRLVGERTRRSWWGWSLSRGGVIFVLLWLGHLTVDRNRDYAGKVAMWRDVVAKQPDNIRAYLALGNALVERRHIDEAVVAFREALKRQPQSGKAYCSLGMALLQQGHMESSRRALQHAIELNPRLYQAHYNLGNLLTREGNRADAIAAYREALKIKPGFADAHCNLGLRLFETGHIAEAEREYREALRINPEHAKAYYNLGNLQLSRNQLTEAVISYRNALRMDPDYANAHNNLGTVLFRMDQMDEAIHHFREALRINPQHQNAQAGLRAALARRGAPTDSAERDP